jgi:hypothetical protein
MGRLEGNTTMELIEKIRELLEESILIEEGSKDRFILNNKNLTESQKQVLINIFNERRILEKEVNWNNKNLTWDDFKDVLIKSSTGALKELKPRKDYVEIDGFRCDDPNFIGAYIPLNHNASFIMASKKLGFARGKWCIAYNGDTKYWVEYAYGTGSASHYADSPSVFIFVVYLGTKYAVQIREDEKIYIWDQQDVNKGDANDIVPGVNIHKEITKISRLISDVREKLDENKPEGPYEITKRYDDGSVDVGSDIDITYNNWYELPNINVTDGNVWVENTEVNVGNLPMVGKSVVLRDCDVDNDFYYNFAKLTYLEVNNIRTAELDFNMVDGDVYIEISGMNFDDVSIRGKITGKLTINYTGDMSYDYSFDNFVNEYIIENEKDDWVEYRMEEAKKEWIENGNDPEDFDEEFDYDSICWECQDHLYDENMIYKDYWWSKNPDCKLKDYDHFTIEFNGR